jgi:hypothetical protein
MVITFGWNCIFRMIVPGFAAESTFRVWGL